VNEVVYTPDSRLTRPAELLREMGRSALASRDVAWRLMLRDLRVQYRQSFLGIVWAFMPAIATTTVFTLASQAHVINVGTSDVPYPAYVMFGMTLWQTFVDALNGPVHALSAQRSVLAKLDVPPEAIVLGKLGEVCFNFAVRTLLTVALFLWFAIPVGWTVLLAPLGVLNLLVLATALGLFIAPINALYEDASKGLSFLTAFWFFLTPIVYSTPAQGRFATLVEWNPVTPLFLTTRELVTGTPLSHPAAFLVIGGVAVLCLVLAWIVYRLAVPIVVERMSV
jgi:lipopolysaccharide transport system permease protein